jgi:protein gp37
MNKQNKGNGARGIEWTDYTWNPVAGCKFGCEWLMPDGQTAQCYAKTVAEGLAQHAYPDGFERVYWHPDRLDQPLRLKTPSKIFLDSMSDLLGAGVPDEYVRAVFDVCRRAYWHDFQILTKNPARLLKLAHEIPANVWAGVSAPPTFMRGHQVNQEAMMNRALECLSKIHTSTRGPRVLWMSLEPLSFDVAVLLHSWYAKFLDWLVIGAASNGRTTYQPDPEHVQHVLNWAAPRGVKIFFKGNLDWTPHLEHWPRGWTPYKGHVPDV